MIIDAHTHFWNLNKVQYPWLTPALANIYRTFEPPELEPQLQAAGIDKTILIQAANCYEDTEYMLDIAEKYDRVAGVVGWVPLMNPIEAGRKLEEFMGNRYFKGVRHLIHDEPDPDWVMQPVVIESLKLLASFGLPFDFVAVFPNHLKHIPMLAEKIPDLRIVIDHLAKPPIKHKQMEPWASQFACLSNYPQVYAKISGLNTAAEWESWSAADIKPYIDHAFEQFGAGRLMFGSDWCFSELAGSYAKVWEETRKAVAGRPMAELNKLFGGTAARFYQLQE